MLLDLLENTTHAQGKRINRKVNDTQEEEETQMENRNDALIITFQIVSL